MHDASAWFIYVRTSSSIKTSYDKEIMSYFEFYENTALNIVSLYKKYAGKISPQGHALIKCVFL